MAEPRKRRVIDFPALSHLLDGSGLTLSATANALRATHDLLYPVALPIEGRLTHWDALHLARLICTVEQVSLLDNPDVVAIGDRCPEQVSCYILALERTIPKARERGVDLLTLSMLQDVKMVLIRLQVAIRPTSAGLS